MAVTAEQRAEREQWIRETRIRQLRRLADFYESNPEFTARDEQFATPGEMLECARNLDSQWAVGLWKGGEVVLTLHDAPGGMGPQLKCWSRDFVRAWAADNGLVLDSTLS